MSFSKRGTMLLIATRMSVWAFKRFLDFILIDKRALNARKGTVWCPKCNEQS